MGKKIKTEQGKKYSIDGQDIYLFYSPYKYNQWKKELLDLYKDKDQDPELVGWLEENWINKDGKHISKRSLQEQYDILAQVYHTKIGYDKSRETKERAIKKQKAEKNKFQVVLPIEEIQSMTGGQNVLDLYKNNINTVGDSIRFDSSTEYNAFKSDLKPMEYNVKTQNLQLKNKTDRENYQKYLKTINSIFEDAKVDGEIDQDGIDHYKSKIYTIRPEIKDSLNAVLDNQIKQFKTTQSANKGFLRRFWDWDWD